MSITKSTARNQKERRSRMKAHANRALLFWALGVTAFLLMGFTLPGSDFVSGDTIRSAEVNAKLNALAAAVDHLEQEVAVLQPLAQDVSDLKALLHHFSRSGDDITVSGANLHIVNGTGTTDGAVNGLGNVIIGYNEERMGIGAVNDRSGSHMLVIGKEHNFSSYGGVVLGQSNETSGIYSSVSGGRGNTASGDCASVSGGLENLAESECSSVTGGRDNNAASTCASVNGGCDNEATQDYASVNGGQRNTAYAYYGSVSGGYDNTVRGDYASVSGGSYNVASGTSSSVSGGS